MTEEYRTMIERTVDCLDKAKQSAGRARTMLGIAKGYHTLLPSEVRTLNRALQNISEAQDQIHTLLQTQRIMLK